MPNAAELVPARRATCMWIRPWTEKTGKPNDIEEDMLDFAFDVRKGEPATCQIRSLPNSTGSSCGSHRKQFWDRCGAERPQPTKPSIWL